MEFLPSINDEEIVVPKRSYKVNPHINALKNRKPLKLNSMPVKEKKLIEDSENSFDVNSEYRLLNILGTGTYSTVHLAERLSDGLKVAIKVSKGTTSGNLLKKEYELLKEIEDSSIPKAIDFKKNWCLNTSYFIMEYFNGIQLDNFISENGTLTLEQAYKITKALSECVSTLHNKGIAHRDIKPQNVLINEELTVKLIDFNISKKGKESTKPSKFTKKFFSQVSSPLYAAPELFGFDCYSESVDIWGLGIILVSMLFGNDFFDYNSKISSVEIYEKFIQKVVESDKLSDEDKEIIKSTLAYDAEMRPTASELSTYLK